LPFCFFCPHGLAPFSPFLTRTQAYVSNKEELQQKVDNSAKARVKDSSRKAYAYSNVRFI